jgi:polysaccharide biosynthesis transport protein
MEYTEEYIDLKQYWLILRRRWLPATLVTLSVMGITALATFLMKPIYEAESEVLLRKDASVASSLSSGTLGALDALTQKTNPVSTEAEILKSEPVVVETIQSLHLTDKNNKPLKREDFLKKLTIKNAKETDILSILYQSTDPKLAATVVNKVVDIYRAKNLERSRSQATSARKFIESQIPKAERDVKRYEVAIREFKDKSKVVSLKEEAKVAVEGLGNLQKALTETQAKLADARSRAQTLRNQAGLSPQQGLQVNSLSQSPAVQKVLTDLQETKLTLSKAQVNLQPGHPQIQDLEGKKKELEALLQTQVKEVVGRNSGSISPALGNIQAGQTQQSLSESLLKVEVERLGLQNQANSLQKAQMFYQQRNAVLPKLEQIQRELERNLTLAETTYGALRKGLQEFSIAENKNVGNTDIIAPATVPDEPIAPKVLLNLIVGTVMGLLLGIGTALVLEALDNSVKTVKEAQDIFDLTVLGTIPTMEGSEKVNVKSLERTRPQLPVRDTPRSAVSEAYRMLQANLKFLSSDNPPRVIAMTSSVPQEGKSTTTANLALVLAEMGHRVLLVDADLRRPSQHQIWELPNSVGLTNILVEPGKWSGSVRSENEHLDIITAGVIPPNPVRLLDSQRMAHLIGEWREHYDFVLIDAPPLAVASDALIVAQMTDGLLMVARPGVLNSASAETAKAALAKVSGEETGSKRATILGLVLNGVIPENEPDSYYYYYAKNYYSAEVEDDPATRNGKASTQVPGDLESSRKSSPKV